MRILIIWGNWGPYHYARFRALHERGKASGVDVHGLELFPSSGVYDWKKPRSHPAVHHLKVGEKETEFNPLLLTRHLVPLLLRLRCDVVFVPSYWHWSLFANLTARLRGARIIMMNESHAGTQRATGWKKSLKRRIVRSFHGGFVGGTPHIEHFTNLGMVPATLFPGYDAIDNRYFAEAAEIVRRDPAPVRERLQLPDRYFLSLGRMVEKKNLPVLVDAFAAFRRKHPNDPHHLVFVGSGEVESTLRRTCERNNLPIFDHPANQSPDNTTASTPPGVHFYGFRQIEENPSFYATASAFVLPSAYEEWGLVVNEAMACSLPVIVSRTAGCAADLVKPGQNGFTFDPDSVEQLAEALTTLADVETARQMGKRSREIIRDWGCERFATGALQAASAAAPHLVANLNLSPISPT